MRKKRHFNPLWVLVSLAGLTSLGWLLISHLPWVNSTIDQTAIVNRGLKTPVKNNSFQITDLSLVCQNGLPKITAKWTSASQAKNYTLERQYPWASDWEVTGESNTLTKTDDTWTTNYSLGDYAYRVKAWSGSRLLATPASKKVTVINCGSAEVIGTTPTSTPVITPPPPIISRPIEWGAYVGDALNDTSAFETLVGKKIKLQAIFIGWGSSNGIFPSEYGPSVRDQGKTLVIFWEQYGATLDQINNGDYDTYIKSFAAAAKSYGGPIILAPLHEMNGNWDPWDGTAPGNSPTKVTTAWRHIHDLFGGVSNVKFAWDVNSTSEPNTTANAISVYYPGDNYVDYVAIDGFNFNNPWQSFSQVFNNALDQVKIYNKPIYLLSMASAEGSQKATWITDALTVQIPKNPNIAGWVWFNANKEQNWLVNSSPAALQAFKAALP